MSRSCDIVRKGQNVLVVILNILQSKTDVRNYVSNYVIITDLCKKYYKNHCKLPKLLFKKYIKEYLKENRKFDWHFSCKKI